MEIGHIRNMHNFLACAAHALHSLETAVERPVPKEC